MLNSDSTMTNTKNGFQISLAPRGWRGECQHCGHTHTIEWRLQPLADLFAHMAEHARTGHSGAAPPETV